MAKAYESDKISIFGGIIAVNRVITEQIAEEMIEIFLEVIIAPDFTEALKVFAKKDNLRLIRIKEISLNYKQGLHIKKVQGGILIQDEDNSLLEEFKIVTDISPVKMKWKIYLFAFKVVKHVKSNAIVFARNKQTLAIGQGRRAGFGHCKMQSEAVYIHWKKVC